MIDLPSAKALILVAVLNNLRDFEITRVLGWYRIPLKSAPKIVSVDFLAFYQTSVFQENKWRIQYVAPVLGHELVTRAELFKEDIDHPRASQEYFKLQIGPLIALPNPILAKDWRRVTFFYTTGEYLNIAQTLDDLIIHSDERESLWRALKEKSNQTDLYKPQAEVDLTIEPDLLAKLLGFPV